MTDREGDIARLLGEERLVEAAGLASRGGDATRASELYERACDFGAAAREALSAGLAGRALTLAAEAGLDDTANEAVRRLIEAGDAGATARVAERLSTRDHHLWAARLYAAIGRATEAAGAFERAGEPVEAARLLEAAREPAHASRVLESAIRREPGRLEARVALGALLLRFGKTEAAVRALQAIPRESPLAREALTYLAPALERLGLREASREAARALAEAGGPIEGVRLTSGEADARTLLFGRYEVVSDVASTPSARVLECLDRVRGERVAIKVFAAHDVRGAGRDALVRFEREVRALGAIEHPNVVPLRDYLPEGPAIVMAWMSGGTLERRIADRSTAPARAVEIACSVLSALGEAHRLGILHRDIKPANVLFDDAGAARLGDFGVAHLGDVSSTATAGIFGTLAYMSPEQRAGRPATVQSDLYGVGVLLLELLTGDKPTPGDRPRTLPSATHRDLDARHDAAVLRLVDADPSNRPADAWSARRELSVLAWSNDVERAPLAGPTSAGSPRVGARPDPGRVEIRPDGALVDTWLRRPVVRVPLDDASLARASAFAIAARSSLQTVLRVDRQAGEIWLDPPRGDRPSGALDDAHLRDVAAGLAALHDRGVVHGHVDPDHLILGPDGACLLFAASAEPAATPEDDRAGLARLGRAGG